MSQTIRIGLFDFTDDEAHINCHIDGYDFTIRPLHARVEVDDIGDWRVYLTGPWVRENGESGSTNLTATFTSFTSGALRAIPPLVQALVDEVREAAR